MIIPIGVMEYVVFVILFGFEFCMLFDVIGFELKKQKQTYHMDIWSKKNRNTRQCDIICKKEILVHLKRVK